MFLLGAINASSPDRARAQRGALCWCVPRAQAASVDPDSDQTNDPARAAAVVVMSYSDVLGTIWRCSRMGERMTGISLFTCPRSDRQAPKLRNWET